MESTQPIIVRPSRDADVGAMLAIYRRHIRHGIEEAVDDSGAPQGDDLRERRKNLRNRRFPHLAATSGGESARWRSRQSQPIACARVRLR